MAKFIHSIKLSLQTHWETVFAVLTLLVITSLGLLTLTYLNHYENRFYPGIFVDGQNLEGMSFDEAKNVFEDNSQPTQHTIIVSIDDIKISSTSAQLGAKNNYQVSLESAYKIGREGALSDRLLTLIKLLNKPKNIESHITYEPELTEQMVMELKKNVDIIGEQPSAKLGYSGSPYSLVINPGENGRELHLDATVKEVFRALDAEYNGNNSFPIPNASSSLEIEALVASTSAQLNESQIEQAKQRALAFIDKKAKFSGQYQTQFINDQDFIGYLTFPEGVSEENISDTINSWAEKLNREPQDAEFEYNQETLKVEKFLAPRNGLVLDGIKTTNQIKNLIKEIENSSKNQSDVAASSTTENQEEHEFELQLTTKEPDVTLEKTNNLGIKEMIGFGESYYPHSIPSRIHNVSITADRISLTIVKPGASFSFNETLGDVSSKTGYQAAYVIRNGATELGDGGGVCQVSSTLFRALLDSGLKITKRLPHSYRVSYYEENSQPGFDATVYAGEVDLRFVNDTDHHILVYSEADSENVYMKVEIYGTSDGRSTEIVDHKTWGYQPPLAPQYIPDPSLPSGVKKQIDWAQSGLKASFKHIVKSSNGEVISEKTYTSSYRPWAAKFLVGM